MHTHKRGRTTHEGRYIERIYIIVLQAKPNDCKNTLEYIGSCSSHFWRGIRFAQVSTQRTRSTDNKNHDNGNEHKKEANQFHVQAGMQIHARLFGPSHQRRQRRHWRAKTKNFFFFGTRAHQNERHTPQGYVPSYYLESFAVGKN